MAAHWDGLMPATRRRGWTRSYGKDKNWKTRHFVKLYFVWINMKRRCINPNDSNYSNYGGRGISVYAPWMDYGVFRIWAISSGYRKGLQLDRINNDGNYEPTNCRWATQQQNNWNRRDTIMVEWEGEIVPLAKLAKEYGKTTALVGNRYRLGWSVKKCLTHPVRKN